MNRVQPVNRVKIFSEGGRTEIWINDRLASQDVTAFELTQEGSNKPVLTMTKAVRVDELLVQVSEKMVCVDEIKTDADGAGVYGSEKSEKTH